MIYTPEYSNTSKNKNKGKGFMDCVSNKRYQDLITNLLEFHRGGKDKKSPTKNVGDFWPLDIW